MVVVIGYKKPDGKFGTLRVSSSVLLQKVQGRSIYEAAYEYLRLVNPFLSLKTVCGSWEKGRK